MNSNKVAIIGGGLSGLVSAKYALENNLEPTVFEKTNQIGGLWSRAKETAIWKGLFTNVSKYSMMFHDHPWPKTSPIFSTDEDIHHYLLSYAEKFRLKKYVRYKTKVEHVKQLENKKWELSVHDVTKSRSRYNMTFDFLIIASGVHSKPRIPDIENSDIFNGVKIHSSRFRLNDPDLLNKRVVVLGCSHSGAEIASCLVGHAKSVISIFPRSYLITPRLIKIDEPEQANHKLRYKIYPVDLFIHRRSFNYRNPKLSQQEAEKVKIETLMQVFSYQTNNTSSHSALYVDLNQQEQEILVAISDYYIQYVKEEKIQPIKSRIIKFNTDSILLENGDVIECDAVIYSTGYYLANDYLDESILKTLKYDTKDGNFFLILYKCTFHPDLENVALIGQTYGTYYTGEELQARWACRVFSGKDHLPSRELMMNEVNEQEKRRDLNRRSQFPYGQHVVLVDKIAQASGKFPNFQSLKSKDDRLFFKLWNTAVVSNHFFLEDKNYLDVIQQVCEIMDRVYESEKNDDDISIEEIAKQFSKFYKIPNGLYKNFSH